MYFWSLTWRILSIILIVIEFNCRATWTFFGIALLWDWNENWLFPVLWPLLSLQICWHIECSNLTASSFRIWSSSAGIPSPPLALFVAMLPQAHLTSCSRMSGSRWVTTPLWLSGSLRAFLYSSSVYSCHLFLISSASVMSLPFLSFIVPIFAWNVPLVSLVFPILLFSLIFCTVHLGRHSCLSLLFSGTLHSVGFIFPFLLCLLLLFISQPFVRSPQTTTWPSCISFSWEWIWSPPPVQCYEHSSIVLQALFVSDLVPWISLSLPVY